jgi:hypothetical protein
MRLMDSLLFSTTIVAAQKPSPIAAVSNAVSTTAAVYTDFDLFKNSGLSFCTINSRTKADPSTKQFISVRNVRNQSEFCSYMAGVPIMIPTIPTETAFFPWYPTYLAQGLSLGLSYIGLFYIFRYLDRSRMLPSRRRLPFYFWLFLLLDFARQVAFHFKTINGFVNPDRFPWTNVLLWLIPLNYVTLASHLHKARLEAIYEEPYAGANLQFASIRSNGRIEFTSEPFPTVLRGPETASLTEQKEAIVRSSFPSATPRSGGFPSIAGDIPTSEPRGLTTWAAIIAAVGMWFLSFVVTILHWKWSYGPVGSSLTRTYPPIPTALSDPQTVGNMPVACLRFLQSGVLADDTNFFDQSTDQIIFALITTLQFVVSSLVLIYMYLRRDDEPFDHAYRILYASAAVTLVMLLIPAFAVGIEIATKVLQDGQVINVRFTNDVTVTGGCTFAFVNMNKQFGYWDVGVERGVRIVMSFLAAA